MKRPKFILAIATIVWLLTESISCSVMAAELQASVDMEKVAVGDSFTLTLTTNYSKPTSPPDLSPLNKSFQILGTSQSSQTRIINGSRTDTTSWIISLASKAKGKITIPSLTVGNDSSNAVPIEVIDASSVPVDNSATSNITIETSLDQGSHYVLEEIPLTIRIFDPVGIREAQLNEPTGNDFMLTKSGVDKTSRIMHNGKETTVIERKYLLKPQKSGTLNIAPFTLRAVVPDSTKRPSAFADNSISKLFGHSTSLFSAFDDILNPGRQLSVRSQPLVIDVKARPTADGNWFLPAKNVELNSVWNTSPPEFQFGEPLTRTIQLFALGASKEQLPDIKVTNAQGARVYLDRTDDKLIETADGSGVLREIMTSIVPTRTDEITLPAIEVKWWDTTADVERVATLPMETYTVAGGPVSQSSASTQTLTTTSSIAKNVLQDQTLSDSQNRLFNFSNKTFLQLALTCSLALVAMGFAVVMAFRIRRSRKAALRQKPIDKSLTPNETLSRTKQLTQLEQNFKQACNANDASAAYSAFMAWLNLAYGENPPDIENIKTISQVLAKEIKSLENMLYAEKINVDWNGQSTLSAFIKAKSKLLPKHDKQNKPGAFPPLYPNWHSVHRTT